MKKLLIVFIGFVLLYSCSQKKYTPAPFPENVKAILEKSGSHSSELEKVFANYQNPEDSLKLKAAYFLIGNMDDKHSYSKFHLLAPDSTVIDFDIDDFSNYEQQRLAWDSLERVYGEIDFKRCLNIKDYDTISADYIINNIELAFQSWTQNPWSKHLDFEQFCEYILPHRSTNEPLENWRSYFIEKYKWVKDSMQDINSPVEAAVWINNDLKSWFRFDPRYYDHPTDQGFSEMIEVKTGRCEDMTNLAIYAMRANGIPVMSDFTPYWANTGNNHAWNAIIDKTGKVVIFMGAEANPGKYKLSNRFAKVYRKTYAKQKNTLAELSADKKKLPGYINNSYYVDVTADYVDVKDVEIKLENEIPDSVEFAYICVFNEGEWRAINWSKIDEDKNVVFAKMGKNIAYLPAFYINNKVVPAGNPFILYENDDIDFIKADTNILLDIELEYTTNRTRIKSSDNIAVVNFIPQKIYQLFYWKQGWKLIGEEPYENKNLKFEDCPSKALYWLKEKDGREYERIFILDEKGEQVWW